MKKSNAVKRMQNAPKTPLRKLKGFIARRIGPDPIPEIMTLSGGVDREVINASKKFISNLSSDDLGNALRYEEFDSYEFRGLVLSTVMSASGDIVFNNPDIYGFSFHTELTDHGSMTFETRLYNEEQFAYASLRMTEFPDFEDGMKLSPPGSPLEAVH